VKIKSSGAQAKLIINEASITTHSENIMARAAVKCGRAGRPVKLGGRKAWREYGRGGVEQPSGDNEGRA